MLLLQVPESSVDANLAPIPGELPRKQPVSAREFSNSLQRLGIDAIVRRDSQVTKDLGDPVGRDRVQKRGLTHVRT